MKISDLQSFLSEIHQDYGDLPIQIVIPGDFIDPSLEGETCSWSFFDIMVLQSDEFPNGLLAMGSIGEQLPQKPNLRVIKD